MVRSGRQETALKLFVVLSRAGSAVTAHAAAHAASHGLTGTEFAILEALYHKGDLLIGDLQRRILVSSGGVTYLVDRLTEKGLVERRECPDDRRARYAALTRKGRALLDRIFPEHADWIALATAGLTLEEQQEAIRLLRALGRGAAAVTPGEPANA